MHCTFLLRTSAGDSAWQPHKKHLGGRVSAPAESSAQACNLRCLWRELAKVLALRDSPGVHSHYHESILVPHRNIVSPTKKVVAQRLHWLLLLFCTLHKPRDYLELQVLRVRLGQFYIQNWDRFRSDLANAEAFLNNIWEYLFSCLRRITHSLHSRQF